MTSSPLFSLPALRLMLTGSLCLFWTAFSTAVEFHLSQVSDVGPGGADSYPEMLI